MRTVSTLVRDHAFSRKVRTAYDDACAICTSSPRLDDEVFGLEAAHIRWANADGPDKLYDGVCLCRMHHHALDKGAIKIDHDMRVQVSPKLARSRESDAMFARFGGERIRLPKASADHPHRTMLEWHWSEVFRA
jgi:putative restriction endonuclease